MRKPPKGAKALKKGKKGKYWLGDKNPFTGSAKKYMDDGLNASPSFGGEKRITRAMGRAKQGKTMAWTDIKFKDIAKRVKKKKFADTGWSSRNASALDAPPFKPYLQKTGKDLGKPRFSSEELIKMSKNADKRLKSIKKKKYSEGGSSPLGRIKALNKKLKKK